MTPLFEPEKTKGRSSSRPQPERPKLVPRNIPPQNVIHRVIMRETFGTSYHRMTRGVNTSRGFYLNIVPNYTLMNVEKPTCFLRKFSPDGEHFIAFSTYQTALEVYRFNGCQAAADLIHECTTCSSNWMEPPGQRCGNEDFLGDDACPNHNKLRNQVFSKFFTFLGTIPLVRDNSTGQQLNRECSLFTECGRYVIVGSANYLPDDPHPPMHVIYQNNESVSPNPRNPLEDYTIYLVDIHKMRNSDSIKFSNDKIFLSHNQGLYLYKDRLAILSVQHQTIHVFQVRKGGRFSEIYKIGRTLYDTDQFLLTVTGQTAGQQASDLPQSRAFGPMPYKNYKEGVVNQLKHRILVFLFHRAVSLSERDGNTFELRRFYQHFDQILCLRMWKMQLLDQNHLFIKYASEEVVTLRSSEPNSQFSLFVVYNMETTEVLNVYDNTSEELLSHFEHFSDFFRNTNFRQKPMGQHSDSNYRDYEGGQHQLTSSPSNNIYANLIQQRFKQTIISAKNGGFIEARKRILAQLPISAQSYTGSPFLDLSLFSYDEKWVSVMERPKACGEHAVHFYGRDCGQLKFRMFAGIQGRHPPPSARRLVAFIFHPTEPFAISVQRTNLEYVVNFHVRRARTCDFSPKPMPCSR